MGEIILKTDIEREIGMLYYVTFDSDKKLMIGKARLNRGGRSEKIVFKNIFRRKKG